MSTAHSAAAGTAPPAADHSHSVPPSAAALVPVVYSGSPAMAIRLAGETADARAAAAVIVSELQSLGCELLRLDSSNLADLHAPGQQPRTLSHVVYNKSYSGAELAQALGSAPATSAAPPAAFHCGFDLQALLDVGPTVWRHCDAAACLGAGADPAAVTLQLFVDTAQLSDDTLQRYRRFALGQQQPQPQAEATSLPVRWNCAQCTFANLSPSSHCDMCGGQRVESAAAALPPPPPPPPPCVPAPPPCDDTVPAAAAAAAGALSSPPLSFSVASWNILSADYAHPATFSYCDPAHLSFSHREPRILSALASAGSSSSGAAAGSDIECLQEVDFDAVARGVFDSPAHGSVFVRRPNQKRDGCLIRWREAAFELVPLPALVAFEPHHHRHRGTAGAGATRKDQTQVRIRSADPRANLDRLGERVKKSERALTATATVDGAAVAADPAAPVAPALAVSAPQAQHSKQLVNLSKRQTHILGRIDLLDERLEALCEQVRAAQAEAAASTAPTSNPTAHPSLASASPSLPAMDFLRPPPADTGTARSRSRSPSCTRGRCASKSPARAPAPQYFHALHFNDLSHLTRSKRNCHSSLYARYKKENIGMAVLLRPRAAASARGRSDQLVLVLNAHLYWSPECEDVKLHQAALLLQQAEELRRLIMAQHPLARVSLVCGGDFNSTPDSDVYALVTRGRVPLLRPLIGAQAQASVEHPPTSASPVPIVSSPFHDIVFAREPVPAPAHATVVPAAAAATAAVRAGDIVTANGAASSMPQPLPASASNGATDVPAPAEDAPLSSSPNVRVRLLLDSTLLRITKWLRAIGVDTVCMSSTAPVEGDLSQQNPVDGFFALARAENRTIVSQNRSLLRRRQVPASAYAVPPGSKEPLVVFSELCRHFGFSWDEHAFYSRCTTCNGMVRRLLREEYETLPFLPGEYKLGVDDDGAPLHITKCAGATCGRVRWWSSRTQLRVRQKLFKVRLDIDVSDEEEWGGDVTFPRGGDDAADDGAEGACPGVDALDCSKNAMDQLLRNGNGSNGSGSSGKVPVSRVLFGGPKPSTSKPKTALAKTEQGPAVPVAAATSDLDIVAARAARKASKMAQKAERAAAAATRKQLNQSRVHFALTADAAALRGDDGDYLFDERRSMADSKAAIACAHAAASASCSSSSVPQSLPVPRELHSQVKASLMDPQAVTELWWTADKKAKMIQVERRIIAETKRTIQQRKLLRAEQQASATQVGAAATVAASTESADSDTVDGSETNAETPFAVAAAAAAAAPPSFAARLHAYWQHVSDLSPIGDGGAPALLHGQRPPVDHSHSLELGSAYASCQGREPAFTNCTPKFIDCIDYLFHSRQSLRVVAVRTQLDRAQLERDGVVGFPTADWPSDHCMLQATFQFK